MLHLLQQSAEELGDKLAFDYCHYRPEGEQHRQLTYRALDGKAREIAAALQEQGAAGERVLVLCPSGIDFISAFFGCIYAGAIAVPVHPPVRTRVIGRVTSIVADVQAAFALTTAALQAELKEVMDGLADTSSLKWCAVDALDPAGAAEWTPPDIDAGSTAFVQYTSGSTNTPKGVVVTHGNVVSNVAAVRSAWCTESAESSGAFWLPLHHDMGLIGSVLAMSSVGATTYLMPPEAFIERPMRWLEVLSRHRAETTVAPNFAYELCVERSSPEERAALDLSNLSTAMCGAEPVRAGMLQRFTEAFRVAGFRPGSFHPVYGLAEATLFVSGGPNPSRPVVRHVDGVALGEHHAVAVAPEHPSATPCVGCGRAQPGHELLIVDPVTRRQSGESHVGEIWLGGPSVAKGYWGRPAETSETFSAVLADTGVGPFLRTGDLGFMLDGELFVTGRLKDLLIIRGRNYYPEDIEATVQDSHPALMRGRGAAISVDSDTDNSAEQLVVVQELDRQQIGVIEPQEVVDAIRTAVALHHEIQPQAVVLVEPLRIPTTSSGKIRRNACRQRFLEGQFEPIAAWHAPAARREQPARGTPENETITAEAIAAWFVAELAAESGVAPGEIEIWRPFAYYGVDSVHAIRMTAALESWLGRELSPTLAYEYPSIDLLSRHLAEKPPEAEDHAAVSISDVDVHVPDAQEPIAVIGIGCRFPGADGPAAFWRLLCDGADAITEVPPERWDTETTGIRWGGFLDQVDQFDAKFFGISPRESVRMDPQQRVLLEVAWEAMEDAGQVPERLAGSRTGVFIGIATNDYVELQPREPELIDAYSGTGNAASIAANRLSYIHDFRGPSMAIDTACSSSLVAVHFACRSLRDGECTLALAGGVNVMLSPALAVNFTKAGVMAADGRCKTFDARADGYVRAEGAGIVVLKRLSQALADGDPVYAVIRGSATNQDGRTNGLLAPSRAAQEAVLAEAYRRADISPGAVQYIEAHGSGTLLGDAIEVKALGAVLAEGRVPGDTCLVGSAKTNIGHLEAAAGVAGLIKAALALHHGLIPPNSNFEDPNPNIPFASLPLRVAQTLTPWPETGGHAVAGVSSFGFGGTNAHVVLTEAPHVRGTPQTADDPSENRAHLLPLSARSSQALAALAGSYELALAQGLPLADLCYTASVRRGHQEHRLAVVGDSAARLSESLAAYRRGRPAPGMSAGHCTRRQRPDVVFVFSGQGSQWSGMGQALHAEEPAFREAMLMCDEAMRPHLDGQRITEMLADPAQHWLDDIGLVQPAIFAIQVALASLWRSWGVEPTAVVGHSMGEVAAAHVAGALTIEDAAQVICGRARLLRQVRGRGAMMATELSVSEAQKLVAGREDRVAVAASNSHRSTVLSGDPAVLAELLIELEQRERFCQWVNVDVASHSPQMDALRDGFEQVLAGLRWSSASVPMYSTVTGEQVAGDSLDTAYWVENLCSPVRFSAAIRKLITLGNDTFVEVSPHPILLSGVREDAEDLGRECALLPSVRRDDRGGGTLLASLGTLYTRGQPVAWEHLYPWGGRCVAAPTYPWQRDRFWLDGTTTSGASSTTHERRLTSDHLPWRGPLRSPISPRAVCCEVDIDIALMPGLADHKVEGSVVLPAAALINLVIVAAADAFDCTPRVLEDVVFDRSLVLADSQPRTVQLVLQGDTAGAVSFECYSVDSDASDPSQWPLLAKGIVHTGEPVARAQQLHPAEMIRSRCPEVIDSSSFYRRLADHGLQYGPSFQRVAKIWRRDGEAIGKLTPAGDELCAPPEGVDAATLDAAFQVLGATLPAGNDTGRGTYVPVGVSELHVHSGSQDVSWAHAVLQAETDAKTGAVEGDVYLLREDGQLAMSVRGLRLQRIAGEPATGEADVLEWLYDLRWRPVALDSDEGDASRSVGAGSWLIFSDGNATSEALCHTLEQHDQSCVIVEPGGEYTRVGHNSYRVDPARQDDLRRVLDDAFGGPGRRCRGVVHLWSLLTEPPEATSADWLERASTVGTCSVMHLVQALADSGWADMPRLWLVTRGVHVVGGGEEPVSIAQAPLWGMGRSINHEHPELRCTRVDLGIGGDLDEARSLVEELSADGVEFDVALRGSERYVARLGRPDLRHPHPAHAGVHARPLGPGEAYRIEYPLPGVLDDAQVRVVRRRAPAQGEVEIRVRFAGLNFIDAMRALGVYPGQDDGPVRVGMECAGTVAAVGEGVDGIRPGDEVIALSMEGVGSFVTTSACVVAAKPKAVSFEAAASIPIAFLTAYYSLHELARLRRGERVLIHSAAGGVGLAAVEVARWLGATVYATAGTPEKRDHLRALGLQHVFDSRSLDFAEQVLAATDGEGVDVVLNSLTGEAMVKSLSVLAPYGRFIEIGKRDIYQHGRLRLWQLRRNASYMVVDVAQLALDRPGYVGEMLRNVADGIEHRALRPLPVRSFAAADTAAAIRCLAQGNQIGKVAVSVDEQAPTALPHTEMPVEFDAQAAYLVTGGLGGIGREVAKWMADQGARHIVLLGRSPASASAATTLEELRAAGIDVVVASADVTDYDQLSAVLDSVRASMPPLRGVVHAAGILDDGIIARLDEGRMRQVMAPKVQGAWNLHSLTSSDPLDFFILFSSAASLLGSSGQAHYAAGNAFLDALASHRRAEGKPALSINWGPWADVGLVNRPEQLSNLARHGIAAIPPTDGLRVLSASLGLPSAQVAVLCMDWSQWRAAFRNGSVPPLLSEVLDPVSTAAEAGVGSRGSPLGDALRHADAAERYRLVQSYLGDLVAAKLGMAPSALDAGTALDRLGVDSLIAVELRTQMERDFGIVVPVVQMLDGPSVASLAEWLGDRLSDQGTPERDDAEEPEHVNLDLTADGPDGASSQWIELLSQVPETSDGDLDRMLRTVLAAREGDDHG